jgi:integrase
LAVWLDPDDEERSKAFATKPEATRYGARMETDRERGDYLDPNGGKVRLEELGPRWLGSRSVDPATMVTYEGKWRLHVRPAFGGRQVKSIRPSEIAQWVTELGSSFSPSLAHLAFHVLAGCLELAVADGLIKHNPAKSKIINLPSIVRPDIVVWADETVGRVIQEHREEFRLVPVIAAACGLRQGEIFGLSFDDFDFDAGLIRIRRQLKIVGKTYIFALPKNDRERFVPIPPFIEGKVREHVERFGTLGCTLPWERVDGPSETVNLLFQRSSGGHIRASDYHRMIWRPALAAAGVIPPPIKDDRSRLRYECGSKKTGMHTLRHYYASVTLSDGVNIKELAEYLGHHDPGFTLRMYAHMLPSSYARARQAVQKRMLKLVPPPTEQSRSTADEVAA